MTETWSKFDRTCLARCVTDVPLTLPSEQARTWPGKPDRRRDLVEALYGTLVEARISYTTEPYQLDRAQQEIRTPREVLQHQQGTCLDLAVLFAGACLAQRLLPVLVLLADHALAAVSLAHDVDSFDALDRDELDLFRHEPTTDLDALRRLVDSGRYLAVEATGFAYAEGLPETVPEGRGRQDGRLPFARAVQAGAEQLGCSGRSLRFALDVVVAQRYWLIRPRRVARELVFDDIAGNPRPPIGTSLRPDSPPPEPEPAPRPVLPAAPAGRALLDRGPELALARHAAPGRPLVFHGAPGSGRSTLLRAVARELANACRDGAVLVSAGGRSAHELLHELVHAFYDDPAAGWRSGPWLRRTLAPLEATIAVDDVRDPWLVAVLAGSLPRARIVAAADAPPVLPAGRARQLGGLPRPESLELLQQVLGRPLRGAERAAGERLWQIVDGHPGRLVQLAALARDGDHDLRALVSPLSAPADVATSAFRALGPAAQAVVRVLLAMPSGALSAAHIDTLAAGEDVQAGLAQLRARELVQRDGPLWRLDRALAGDLAGRVEPAPAAAVVDRFVSWTARQRSHPQRLADDVDVLAEVVAMAVRAGNDAAVVRLARSTDVVLQLSGRVDAYRDVLDAAAAAAERLPDRAAAAWVLHQRGSLAAGLGARRDARRQLGRARRLRHRLGERDAERLTRHNLALLGPHIPLLPRSRRGRAALAAVLTVAAVAGAWWLWLAVRTGPLAVVQPDALDFGRHQVGGDPVVGSVIVSNSSDEPVTLSASLHQAGADFALADEPPRPGATPAPPCASELGPRGRCALTVAFAPTRSGRVGGVLLITSTRGGDTAAGPALAVTLAGEGTGGPVPDVTVLPTALRMGRAVVGGEPVTMTVQVTNPAADGLSVTSTVDGRGFTVAGRCARPLPPGARCSLAVRFAPPVQGRHSGRLVVTATPAGSGADPSRRALGVVALSGEGVRDGVALPRLRPSVHDFGTLAFGGSDQAVFTVSNQGAQPVRYGGASLPAGAFAVRPGPGACRDGQRLTEGDGCTVTVEVTIDRPGPQDATLQVRLDGQVVPLEAALRVEGGDPPSSPGGTPDRPSTPPPTPPRGVPRLAPASIDYGTVAVGSARTERVDVSNDGSAPLTVTAARTGGAAFAVDPGGDDCSGTTLAPGDRCKVQVTVSPSARGTVTGDLTIEFDDLEPAEVVLSAVAVAAVLRAAPDPVLVPWWGEPGRLVLTNDGDLPLTIREVRLVDPDPSAFVLGDAPCAAVLQPGTDCSVQISLPTTTARPAPGTLGALRIVSDSPGSPATVALAVSDRPPSVLQPAVDADPFTGYELLADGRVRIPVLLDAPLERSSVAAQRNVRLRTEQVDDAPLTVELSADATALVVTSTQALGTGPFWLALDGDSEPPVRGAGGLALDGDGDGAPGGLYERRFDVLQ